MDKKTRLHLDEMLKEYKPEETTEKIRELKHSQLIKESRILEEEILKSIATDLSNFNLDVTIRIHFGHKASNNVTFTSSAN